MCVCRGVFVVCTPLHTGEYTATPLLQEVCVCMCACVYMCHVGVVCGTQQQLGTLQLGHAARKRRPARTTCVHFNTTEGSSTRVLSTFAQKHKFSKILLVLSCFGFAVS